ncbi:hypothetical protein GGR56DRAFT_374616 [Xylariaceae sp. FL0804]|nr:hypothetical protein GGR56DRAFT_374616 [Xylariaceae sp. FL0804]
MLCCQRRLCCCLLLVLRNAARSIESGRRAKLPPRSQCISEPLRLFLHFTPLVLEYHGWLCVYQIPGDPKTWVEISGGRFREGPKVRSLDEESPQSQLVGTEKGMTFLGSSQR